MVWNIVETTNREGITECFVSGSFTDEETGLQNPFGKWLSNEEYALYQSDHSKITEIMAPYASTAKEIQIQTQQAIQDENSVTMRQARLALFQMGLLDIVKAAVESAGPAAKIDWEYAATVDKNYPLVVSLKSILGFSDDQVDSLFELAKTF